jgi:hypothetical protein
MEMEMGKGDRKWMESDGVVDRWMRKRRGAEEDARGDGSSIGVMELGPEFLGREELGLSGLCTSLIRGYA